MMRVFAYCGLTFERSMRKAAGVEPLTCPPLTAETFPAEKLEGNDLIMIDLHGLPGEDYWYEERRGAMCLTERLVALRAGDLAGLDLNGAVVFATNCYLGDEDSPMAEALVEANAGPIIAAPGLNYGGKRRLAGANELGFWFRLFLAKDKGPQWALDMAKQMARMRLGQDASVIADTMEFEIIKGVRR